MLLKKVLLFFGVWAAMGMAVSCISNNEEDLYPPDTCDTTLVTYSGVIAPIIDQHCLACHNAVDPSSGIPLEGYANLKEMVDAGRLLGAVRRENGFAPMPQNGPMLPDCDILQMEIWVSDGAPEN
jgi:mono/diheme cytochrome c family protein